MKYRFLVTLTVLIFPLINMARSADDLKYIDASTLQLIGKGFNNTKNLYQRLPDSLEGTIRPVLWTLSKDCSGMAIRFRTDSKVIAARWEVERDVSMNHFSNTGIKGLDLYCMNNGKWQFIDTARPKGKSTTAVIINNMNGEEREYMLYLPLYDGIVHLEIGVEPTSEIEKPQINSPRKGKPVVFYGTSITQGGCASRAGMSYPNQLSRMLNREIINLGFSGNAFLDYEIAEAMTSIDASCYVIDCLPNVHTDLMNEKYLHFLNIIRDKRPNVPVLLVENIHYPLMQFDSTVFSKVHAVNKILNEIYRIKRNSGDKYVFYLKSDSLIGDDYEGTVDGIHLTDLGFYRITQQFYPVIKKLIDDK